MPASSSWSATSSHEGLAGRGGRGHQFPLRRPGARTSRTSTAPCH